MINLRDFLDGASIDSSVFSLRPDYRALLIAVDGIKPGESNEMSESMLVEAEKTAAELTAQVPVEELAHIASWREAYRAFGAKPQRTRNSLEALTRRAAAGLPRINRLTDIYNAISVKHQIPLGGEDLTAYSGAPRLTRASGQEEFATLSSGEPKTEHPKEGEVIWRDDIGVTCRIWNWRQGVRTGLSDHTTTALFILDALDPLTTQQLEAAGAELIDRLSEGENIRTEQRLIDR